MPNTTRSIGLAAIVATTLLANAMPASAGIRGGGHFGGGHAFFGRSIVHSGALRGPGGPTVGGPGRGHLPPRGPVLGWHHHHHGPVYGGPVIPVAVATGAAIADAPAVAGVSPGCAIRAGSFVTVTFLPTVTAADVTNFLRSYNVTMAGGPDKDGVYTIRLAEQVLPQAKIAEVIASMRGQAAIVKTVDG